MMNRNDNAELTLTREENPHTLSTHLALTVTRDYILEEKYSIWMDDSMRVEALEIKHQVFFFSSAFVDVILSMNDD